MSPLARLAAACLISLPLAVNAGESVVGLDFPGSNVVTLGLGEAIQMALTNNLEVEFDKVTVDVEQARTRFATGVFDPVFRLEIARDSIQRPDITSNLTTAESLLQQAQILAIEQNTRAIQLASGQPVTEFSSLPDGRIVVFDQDTDRFESSLSFLTPLGTQLAFVARESKIRTTFDGDPRTITPFYQAFGGVEVRQPLLKGFGPDATLLEVRSSRVNERVAALTWEKTLSDAIGQVISTYIDMVFAESDMRTKMEAIEADQKLAQQNQRRLELGFMSPIDVQQARAQVSLDEEQLIQSKNLFMERQLALRRLITKESSSGEPAVFMPVKMPALAAPESKRDNLLVTAFRKRPDYNAAVTDAEKQDLRLKYAKNQRWPSLDLVGSFGYNGLAGHWESARDAAQSSQAPQWSFGVQFSMPLGGVQPRAQLDVVRGLRQQALLRIKQTELTVTVDVDTALSRIEMSRQRLETARNTRDLNEEAVRIAYRRLEEGQLSSFDLIEQQRKLYDAKSRELAARAELDRAIVALWAATGTVLDHTGVNIVRPNRRGELPKATKVSAELDSKAIKPPSVKQKPKTPVGKKQ
ncbi:MAG TPA: TolC family protein [Candidatus Kapabacteria bacterium]|nr:TolC family protein [Candidatus Kapabacteria bacterium]